MKSSRRIICFIITVFMIMSCPMFTGCTGFYGEEGVDKSKTQFYVGNCNGGIGDRWLKEYKIGFEAKYKDTSFEEGKTGVQIWINNDKSTFASTQLINTLPSLTYNVIFTEGINYYDFIANDLFLDITDVVQEKLDGEDVSIESKLTETQKAYLKQDGKYYALPHYQTFRGIVYDVQLFADKGLYFSADGSFTDTGVKSAGPDGKSGNYDDGLPATFAEFFELCDYMTTLGIVPISWTGEYRTSYTGHIMDAIYADYEGVDNANLRKNYGKVPNKDTAEIVTGFEGDTPIITPTKITLDNYDILKKQAGRYYAMDFLSKLAKNNYYSKMSMNDTQSHVMTQSDFIYSSYEIGKENRITPIGMMVEGTWWEEEANQQFLDMEQKYGESASRKNRKFAFMPIPKVDSKKLGKPTLYDGNNATCFINANVTGAVEKIAKLFLKYVSSDEALQTFTKITGATRDYNYKLTDETYNSLSNYSKSIYDMRENNGGVVYGFNTSKEDYAKVKGKVIFSEYLSKVNGKTCNNPINSFVSDGISAKDYFSGLQ